MYLLNDGYPFPLLFDLSISLRILNAIAPTFLIIIYVAFSSMYHRSFLHSTVFILLQNSHGVNLVNKILQTKYQTVFDDTNVATANTINNELQHQRGARK